MILKRLQHRVPPLHQKRHSFYQVARLRQSTLVYKIRLKIYNVYGKIRNAIVNELSDKLFLKIAYSDCSKNMPADHITLQHTFIAARNSHPQALYNGQ